VPDAGLPAAQALDNVLAQSSDHTGMFCTGSGFLQQAVSSKTAIQRS